jgi:hypothetical protein
VVDDLKKGYYLLFIDGGKRANEQGQAEGAIGVILQEPDSARVPWSIFRDRAAVEHERLDLDIGMLVAGTHEGGDFPAG